MAFNYDWQQAAYLHPNQHCQFGAVVNFFLCDRISCDNRYYETIDGKTTDITEEIPFDIPDSWAWCRLRNFCITIVDCPHSTPHYQTTPTSCWAIDTNCIDKNGYIIRKRFLGDNEFIARTKQCVPRGNDIIMSREGTIGLVAILPTGERICLGQRVMLLRPSSNCIPLYMRNTLATEKFLSQFLSKSRGMGVQHINVEDIRNGFFPLPPLAEQQRIVEQIKKLLGYVDIIDTDAETLEKSITLAKQKILDLAIRGKLVPQDPTDEPASELLKKIKAEKEALVKAGKIKKDKHESFIFKGDDNCYYEQLNDKTIDITAEIPFDLPESWSWCRLYSVVEICDNLRKPINAEERQKRIKSANNLYPYYGATGQVGWIDDFISDGEFVLLGEDGAPFLDPCTPKAYIICGKAWVNNHAHVLKGINNQFLCHCLNSVDYTNFITGTTRYKLTQAEMVKILLPTPPLAEQQRIVQAIAQYNSILGLISK